MHRHVKGPGRATPPPQAAPVGISNSGAEELQSFPMDAEATHTEVCIYTPHAAAHTLNPRTPLQTYGSLLGLNIPQDRRHHAALYCTNPELHSHDAWMLSDYASSNALLNDATLPSPYTFAACCLQSQHALH